MSNTRDYKTDQENFWAGKFGDDYVGRSSDPISVPARINMFSEIIKHTSNVNSFLEFGANVGLNLHALKQILPIAVLQAVEINESAFKVLAESFENVKKDSFLTGNIEETADFVFTSGVLIHINPDELANAYQALYKASTKYIMVNEYYSPVPVTIDYRGNKEKLYKRDFAGELLDAYPDLQLVTYGFVYRRDQNFPMDDTNWFLLEKR
jgi:spore coat polysaccharide biosynthesis protein SpsF